MGLARKLNPSEYSLAYLCEQYGIKNPQAHSSFGDTIALACVIPLLVQSCEMGGWMDEGDIEWMEDGARDGARDGEIQVSYLTYTRMK